MRRIGFLFIAVFALLAVSLPVMVFLVVEAADSDFEYLVGRGIADVTGPPVGVQMWGFVREDQIAEGIHFRLFSRAFVVAERNSDERIAFVSVDLGSITHAMHLQVVENLRARFGETYTPANVVLSATHTHGGPGGYWHYGTDGPIGSAFHQEHFDAIAGGITASIVRAHEDLQPGSILVNTGTVEGAGANRSAAAYLNNPEEERGRYDGDTDKGMTLLRFADVSGDVGMVNWFASHPTAMNYYNKLISGDHKGHASAKFETRQGVGFVAAFAQSNAGDISPNLNLDNTGPGETDMETTRIIAERQYETAVEVFDGATEKLSGPITIRQAYVNFAYLPVGDEFTGAGPQTTCPSAYGYAFAAGSTEDGGGHPLFREGMKTRNAMIDGTVKELYKLPDASEQCRECHADKAVLFAPGESDPPAQSQDLSLTLVRVGQLALVCAPAEVTTMAGRRLRETVADALGDDVDHVVLVGYANGYGGYVTTREEYATQQYEGGHTLFGPWTLAAYQQEFTRLATAMTSGRPVEPGEAPVDMRGKASNTPLEAPVDVAASGADFGEVAKKAKRSYKPGDTATVSFWTGDPRNDLQTGNSYLAVQRETAEGWVTVATDNDWSTTCRWVESEKTPTRSLLQVEWNIPPDTGTGSYRIVHEGSRLSAAGGVGSVAGESRVFKVK